MPPKRIPPVLKRKLYANRQPLLKCLYCDRSFRNLSGLSQHKNAAHPFSSLAEQPPLPTRTSSIPASDDQHPTVNPMTPSRSASPSGSDTSRQPTLIRNVHLGLNGQPCDSKGDPLLPDTPPPLYTATPPTDWTPFGSRLEFDLADFLFTKNQASAPDIDFLMDTFAGFGYSFGASPPFADAHDLYNVIDSIPLGDAPWHSFTGSFTGSIPNENAPHWMTSKYDVWCRNPLDVVRNMLSNPEFKGQFDYAPYRQFDQHSCRHYDNFMSGNWAWRHADTIVQDDPTTKGSLFVPIILGSDKTTVSVATGQNEYYPLYMSIGNVHNNVRRAHRNAVVVIGFLAIPKSDRKDLNSKAFRKFRRQLFHSSISTILHPLHKAMSTPEVTRCPDGHFRRVIYGLGPYIADYPEQVLASCIVQGWCPLCPRERDRLDHVGNVGRRSREHTEELIKLFDLTTLWDDYGVVGDLVPFTNDFPRADIHELLSGDILHQVIKGTFKDHLVTWVCDYLVAEHGETRGNEILDEIDRRIAAVLSFSGLRHFHQGRDFKQWTGDDSKALMKVYIPAIVGLVPDDMVHTLSSFMECCYIIRRSILSDQSLAQLEASLGNFHRLRKVFEETGVRPDGMSLPRQHSLDHYPRHIREFGAPNGLCSSITESKHIKAVKEPWRRSNRFEALGQMLLTNQRLDKLAAARCDFEERGMLKSSLLSSIISLLTQSEQPDSSEQVVPQQSRSDAAKDDAEAEEDAQKEADAVEGPRVMANVMLARTPLRNVPRSTSEIAAYINNQDFPSLVARFLYNQLHLDTPLANDVSAPPSYDRLISNSNHFKISLFTSAIATFYAPSDISGIGGMRFERIRATRSWRKGPPRYDCVFVETNADEKGMRGLHVARVRLFFSFKHEGVVFPCALIEWFEPVVNNPDELTGMWVVEPEFDGDGIRECAIIHLDSIVRAAHLIPVYGVDSLPPFFHFSESLDAFQAYYVNKYVDHHAHEIAF
ncbi:hypothetical protein QCA50_012351 [Cerrena zonata]|uniref:C2H2-type domain-containing protein n=1 Tax=Cerrena zonata TaxID=2478898 RepID=A0AAW0FYA8_9APHY